MTYQCKKWSFLKVNAALVNILDGLKNNKPVYYNTYYIGGSLCIDFSYHPCVVLNQNGRGFFYKFPTAPNAKNSKFVMTNGMHKMVREIYQIVKGKKEVEVVENSSVEQEH